MPLTLVLALLAAAPADASAAGLWATPVGNGRVEIAECGAGLCGKLMDADRLRRDPNLKDGNNRDPALRNRPGKGLPLFEGWVGGPPRWKGRIYNPQDGRTYAGSAELVGPDRLKLQGCVFYPLCMTEVWTRVR